MICIGCGCDEQHACCEGTKDGMPIRCCWVATDPTTGRGICSRCRTISMIGYAEATGRLHLYDREDTLATFIHRSPLAS